MQRARTTCLVLAVFVGCREPAIVTSPRPPRISADIVDGAHGGGNPHFFFLPPMVRQPSFTGVFNPNLGPLVQICTLTATAAGTACDPTITPITPGPVQVDVTDQQYQVNWNTGATNVTTTHTYRIQVFAANDLLGFADVQPVNDGSALTNLRTGETIGLVDGRTLPIKFRIENGALCVGPAECGEGTAGPTGATIVSQNKLAGVLIPAGALANTVTVLVAQNTTAPCLPIDLVQRVECYDFVTSPPGQFQSNVTVAICVDLEGFTGLPPAEKPWFLLHRLDVVNNQAVVTPLPNASATFLPCDASEVAPPPVGMRGLDRWLALAKAGAGHIIGLFTPRKLYAFHLGVGGSTCCFSRIGWALPAAMAKNLGDGQTAVVGTAVAVPPSVILRDSGGTPAVGEAVTFSVGSGGGTVTGARQVTDQNGVATVGRWMLGPSPGANTLIATSRGAVGSPVTFTATGVSSFTLTKLSAGWLHACGLAMGGIAYCWGDNTYGALGNGTTTSASAPAPVAGGLTFATLSAGVNYTCGVTTSGSAYCWGDNTYGRLGNGTTVGATAPVAVSGGLSFATISTGTLHTCGVTTGGAAYCWGDAARGELGMGSTVGSQDCPSPSGPSSCTTTPVAVSGALTFRAVSVGNAFTCGVTASGAGYCWGFNLLGELGNGTTTGAPAPVPVLGGSRFAVVSAGAFHACGVATGGAAYCWGDNRDGELGIGTTAVLAQCNGFPCSTMPLLVSGGLAFGTVSAFAGATHNCGVTNAGAAYCWGGNFYGELGNGTVVSAAAPVSVSGGLTFVTVSMGQTEACGVTMSGTAYCWGGNFVGELGIGTTTGPQLCSSSAGSSFPCSPTPVPVSGGLTFAAVTVPGAFQLKGLEEPSQLSVGLASSSFTGTVGATTWRAPAPVRR